MKSLFILFFPFTLLAQVDTVEFNPDLASNFISDSISYNDFEKTHGRYIKTSNVNMHYFEWGAKNDRTLVWIHGTYSNGTEIIEFVDTIVENGFHIIAIDYYGHGRTPFPEKEVTLYHVADDIKLLLDSLKIKTTYLAGWSRGGSIATAFYDEYPAMVNGIILIDGGAANWIRNRQQLPEDLIKDRFNETEKQLEKTFYPSLRHLYQANYTSEYPLWNIYNFSFFGKEENGWIVNPNLQRWLQDDSIENHRKKLFNPGSCGLFHQSTVFMLPEMVYRNLETKILIIDPLKDDEKGFFAYSNEYAKIKDLHPSLMTIIEYPNATHGVIFEEPNKLQKDIIKFLK